VDDAVTAKIIDIKDGKISLSLKALKADPWEKAGEKYKEGEVVHGKVYSFNPFGAIVSLDPEIQGQIHVTEFGSVEEMKKHLTLGNEYNFTVESVKVPEKRIMLKLKK
jgi:small subunit ribosomal protein S1